MRAWQLALAAAGGAAAFLFLSSLILYRLCRRSGSASGEKTKGQSGLYAGVVRLGNRDPVDSALKHSSRVASVWRTTYPIKPFNWSEHPTLIAEAVEHGWATFAFTYTCSRCPVPSNMWNMCTGCSHGEDYEPEIAWEVGGGADHMQKIRLNPGLMIKKDTVAALVQALQTALPLPGPPLGTLSFPQEGYYEITILAEGHEYSGDLSQTSLTDNEHVKLISKNFSSKKHMSSDATFNYANQMFETRGEYDSNRAHKDGSVSEKGTSPLSALELSQVGSIETPPTRNASLTDHHQVFAIGLAAGGAPPFRLPGCDPGSVGFHSSGRVLINGVPHVQEDPKYPITRWSWGAVNATVGCGFDPAAKRVFFTLNGELVYQLTVSGSEFGSPLYPIIAANYDVTLLANFGQSSFEYMPANSHRVPDPCFRRPLARSVKNGSMYEDSGELFSMGRIDSQYLAEQESSYSQDLQHRHVLSEAESDLFEIVLDSRSVHAGTT